MLRRAARPVSKHEGVSRDHWRPFETRSASAPQGEGEGWKERWGQGRRSLLVNCILDAKPTGARSQTIDANCLSALAL
jgi:hypothetical protein